MLKKLIFSFVLTLLVIGCTQTPTDEATNNIKKGTLSTPVISSDAGDVISKNDFITIATDKADAEVYYTIDESEPSVNNGSLYSGQFTLPDELTATEVMVRARSYKTGYLPSYIGEKIFTVSTTDTPVDNPTDTTTDTPVDNPTDTTTDTPVDNPTDTTTDTPVDDVYLSNIKLSTATLDKTFNKEIYNYNVNVLNAVESIKIQPFSEKSDSTILVNSINLASGSFSNDIPLTVGITTITVLVKNVTSSAIYTIEVTRQNKIPSSNNFLKTLTLSTGTLDSAFDKNTLHYTVALAYNVKNIIITAEPEDTNSSVKINDLLSPATIGTTDTISVTIKVIAESGVEKIYTIAITKLPAPVDCVLASLEISGGTLSPVFNAGTLKYTAKVSYETISSTVTAISKNTTETVTINDGASPRKVLLKVGVNDVLITLVNPESKVEKTYTIVITRQDQIVEYSNNANLSNITLSGASLTPVFNSQTFTYTSTVGYDVSTTTVSAVKEDNAATVEINGVVSSDKSVSLQVGVNEIIIKVTAEDLKTIKTYSISVTREPQLISGTIILHVKNYSHIYYWSVVETNVPPKYPNIAWHGIAMTDESNGWYGFTFDKATKTNLIFTNAGAGKTADLSITEGEYWYIDNKFVSYNPEDAIKPVVSLLSPANGSNLVDIVTIRAEASDNVAVDKVVFLVDQNVVGEVKVSPYTLQWDSGLVSNGAHILSATAYDKAGNSADSAIFNFTTENGNRPPVAHAGVDITAIKGATIAFNGSKSYDPNGTITSYSWDNGLSGVTPAKMYSTLGTFTVVLTVTDNEGASSSDSVIVKIVDQIPHRDFREETVYFMMTDRFSDGNKTNNNIWGDEYLPGGEATMYDYSEDKSGVLSYYHGGDFDGIIANLDYIKEMGFTAIWITPVVKQPEGRRFNAKDPYEASAFHGYWGYDFDQIDPHLHSLGKDNDGWADFDKLVNALHAKGMKLMLDIVVNHGQPGDSVKDSKSKWADKWNTIIMDGQTRTFDKTIDPLVDPSNPLTGFFSYAGTNGTWLIDLIDFNANGPAENNAMPHLKNVYKKFIDHGVDAFRIDTVAYMSKANWEDFTDSMYEHAVSKGNEHFYMIGEAWTGDRAGAGNAMDLVYGSKGKHFNLLDLHNSSIDFPGWLGQVFKGDKGFEDPNVQKIYGPLGDQSGIYDPTYLGTFVDNHDVFRANGILTKTQYMNNLNYIYLFRGVPIVYYGTEAMYSWSKAYATTNKDDVVARWMLGDEGINYVETQQPDMYKHIKMLNSLRKESEVLRKGQQTNLRMNGGEAVIKREYNGKTAYVGMSIRDTAFTYSVTGLTDGTYKVYTPNTAGGTFNSSTVTVSGGTYSMNIPANSFVIIEK